LVSTLSSAPVRMLNNAVDIAWLFSKSMAQTVLGRKAAPQPELRDAVCRPAAVLKKVENSKDEGLPADLLSVRRYGNE